MGEGGAMEPATGRQEARKKMVLRWERVIIVAIILLTLLTAVFYVLTHERPKDTVPEKPKQDGVLPDQRPPCGTTGHPCPNQTCPPGEECML